MLDINYLKKEQLDLHNKILDKAYIEDEEEILNKTRIGLMVELGEFLNECPNYFKYWKHNAKVDKAKKLEEFADVLHLALVIDNINHKKSYTKDEIKKIEAHIKKVYSFHTLISKDECILAFLNTIIFGKNTLVNTISLGLCLEISYEEMEEYYFKKHNINIDRQENNY